MKRILEIEENSNSPTIDLLEEKDRFVSKVLPPFARKTPTVEAILSAAYLAGISSNKFSAMLYDVLGEEAKPDLKFRGLTKAPKLAVCDGALGFQNAVDEIWGQLKIQRCWFLKSTKGNGSSAASVAMAFKLCLQAEKNWRRLRGFKQLELVAKNIIFVDGEEKKAA